MFWADNFTTPNAEYVAFCDTDTLFITYVDKLDLFSDKKVNGTEKPVVLGQVGRYKSNSGWITGTLRALQLNETMKCMVIIYIYILILL